MTEKLDPKGKIEHILEETRVVLPGTQALLGFQFASFFQTGFEKLPDYLKYAHMTSLSFVVISTILLLSSPAYHQIVDKGNDSEHFYRFAARVLVIGMVTLALGLCIDIYIVAQLVTKSFIISALISSIFLFFVYMMWFGFTFYLRQKKV